MQFEDLKIGQALPGLDIDITVALIAGGAIATRDYFPGHHDLEAARALGSPHVFMNILTTNGLVQRFVEQWSGPAARFKAVKIKLGMPNYPGDTLRLSAEVSALDPATRVAELTLKGSNSMGNHVTGTVSVMLPKG
jgi:acyl dehydratase